MVHHAIADGSDGDAALSSVVVNVRLVVKVRLAVKVSLVMN